MRLRLSRKVDDASVQVYSNRKGLVAADRIVGKDMKSQSNPTSSCTRRSDVTYYQERK